MRSSGGLFRTSRVVGGAPPAGPRGRAALLAWATRAGDLFADGDRHAPAYTPPSAGAVRSALRVAALLVVAGALAFSFPRWAQTLFVLGLFLPALVLRRGELRGAAVRAHGSGWALAFVAAWVLWRVLLARHDPRAADLVDMWHNFAFFTGAAETARTDHAGSESGLEVYLLS